MVSENAPPGPTVVDRVTVAKLCSVFVAATVTLLPASVVPVTVTESVTADWSGGAVTVSAVVPCAWRT